MSPLSGSKNKPSKKKAKMHVASATGFLLGLFFDPENGGNMFLRNVRPLSATT
jgi:hypothetical protein